MKEPTGPPAADDARARLVNRGQTLQPGDLVEVGGVRESRGIAKDFSINGRLGLVAEWDGLGKAVPAGHYLIEMGQPKPKMLPRENLRLVAPREHAPAVGDLVEVDGLVGAKQLNGLFGYVVELTHQKGRFVVNLGPAGQKSLRPKNLDVVLRKERTFKAGDLVMAFGLKSAATLNGKSGRVRGLDNRTGRYHVNIVDLSGKQKALRPANIRLVMRAHTEVEKVRDRAHLLAAIARREATVGASNEHVRNPAIVMFAEREGCDHLRPLFYNACPEFPDVQFLEVDVDELPKLAKRAKVTVMPTFVCFTEGLEVGRFSSQDEHTLPLALKSACVAARDGRKFEDDCLPGQDGWTDEKGDELADHQGVFHAESGSYRQGPELKPSHDAWKNPSFMP